MNPVPARKVLMACMLIGAVVFTFNSCSDDEDDDSMWTYLGLREIVFEEIDTSDEIMATDTLRVHAWGYVPHADRALFSRLEETRTSHRADLVIYAKAYAWCGDGPMPPSDWNIYCDHEMPPPFFPDSFVVAGQGAGGTMVEEKVIITQ